MNNDKRKKTTERVYMQLYAASATCLLIVGFFIFALQVATASLGLESTRLYASAATSPSQSPSSSASPSPSASVSPSPSASVVPAPSATPTPKVEATPVPKVEATPVPRVEATPIPAVTSTPKPTPKPVSTPVSTPTITPSPIATIIIPKTLADEGYTFVRGDVNNDGLVDQSDSVFLTNSINNLGSRYTLSCKDAGDIDDNGIINSKDVAYLQNYLFLGGSAPVQPFPTAGIDTTSDNLNCLLSTYPKYIPAPIVEPKVEATPAPTPSASEAGVKPVVSPLSPLQTRSLSADGKIPENIKKQLSLKQSNASCTGNFNREFNVLLKNKRLSVAKRREAMKAHCERGYTIDEVFQAYVNGKRLVHSTINSGAWRKSKDYKIDIKTLDNNIGGGGSTQIKGIVKESSKMFRRGDANIDGTVDVSDITEVTKRYTTTEVYKCEDAADANDDGQIDISDAVAISSWLYSGGKIPPAPGPFNIGVDPSDDSLGCSEYPQAPLVERQWQPKLVRTQDFPEVIYMISEYGYRFVFPWSYYHRDSQGNLFDAVMASWYKEIENQIITISRAELESYPIQGNITIRPGTYFVKISSDPKIYAIETGEIYETLRWAKEDILNTLYGSQWSSRVVTIADAILVNYAFGDDLTSIAHPDHTLFTYGEHSIDDNVYILEKGLKRRVTENGMYQNYLDDSHIFNIDTSIVYPDGVPLENFEEQIAVPRNFLVRGKPEEKTFSLTVSLDGLPPSQNVVAGTLDHEVDQYIFDATDSDSNITITQVKVGVGTVNTSPAVLDNIYLFDGSRKIPVKNAYRRCNDDMCKRENNFASTTIDFAVGDFVIEKGTKKTIRIVGDVSTADTSGEFFIYLDSGDYDVTAINEAGHRFDPIIIESYGTRNILTSGGDVNVGFATDPRAAMVIAGTTADVGKFILSAKIEPIQVPALGFEIVSPDGGIVGNHDEIDVLELWEQGGAQALGSVSVNANRATITPALVIAINKNEGKTFVIKARFANLLPPSSGSPAESGAGIAIKLSYVDAKGTTSGSSYVNVGGIGQTFKTFTVFKSIPTVAINLFNGKEKILGNSQSDLLKFSVQADAAGPIGLSKFTFVVNNTIVNLVSSGYELYESTSASDLGVKISDDYDFYLVSTSTGTVIESRFDTNNDSASVNAHGLGDHLMVSAGTTRYFTLQGVFSGHDNIGGNESVAVSLAGDSSFAGTRQFNYSEIDSRVLDNDFIWSDYNFDQYATSSATNTKGWFNGFRVPGLDSSTSTPQILTE